jgi:hypothetical protein
MTYYDTVDRMVYLQEGRDFRKFAQSNIQAEYSTRQSLQPRCNVETDGTTVSSLPNSAVPVTLQETSSMQVYTINNKNSQFPSGPIQDTLSTTLDIPQVSHKQNLQIPWEEILSAASKNILTITTDRSCDPKTGSTTYSWVFSAVNTLCKSSGIERSQGSHPYRAELSSILARLLVLQWAEQQDHSYCEGRATFINDSQKAICQVFHKGPVRIKDATQDEYDVVLTIRSVSEKLRTTIEPLCVTGHFKSVDNRGEQAWNEEAHRLAVECLHNGGSDEIPVSLAVSPSVVSILHMKTTITSGLPQQILANLHYNKLLGEIIKG